jgi:alpha-1,2-mannosyltransferase
VGQFRPEKDHSLQLRSFKLLKSKSKDFDDVRLAIVGSCRDEGDRMRVEKLQKEAADLGISDSVNFHLNVSFLELQQFLGKASVGLHTMWNEHFGIGVVEMQAAGLVTVAHASGGPESDIIIKQTGFLAATDEEYANHMETVFTKANDGAMLKVRQAGRKAASRFSDEVFHESFMAAIKPIFRSA